MKTLPAIVACAFSLAAFSPTLLQAQQPAPGANPPPATTTKDPNRGGTSSGTNASTTSNDPGQTTPHDNSMKSGGIPPELTLRNRAFLEKASKASGKEIEISQAALNHLTSERARSLAEGVIADHQKIRDELVGLATARGLTPPVETDRYLSEWSRKSEGLEKDYLKQMQEDHREALKLFEKATESNDKEIAAFAKKTLPILQRHLTMANDEVRMLK